MTLGTVQGTRRGSQILELVPHNHLSGDLPAMLVQIIHTGSTYPMVQSSCRPLRIHGDQGVQIGEFHFSNKGHSIMHRESSLLLVDIRSPTFQMVSSLLKPLEHAEYLFMTYSKDGRTLLVDLPRFGLSFFLNSGRLLESKNMLGMVIDSNQSTNTMFGLKSQLILRAKDSVAEQLSRSRRVMSITLANCLPRRGGEHLCIVVDTKTQSQSKVDFYEYTIDNDLGRLIGNASLTSKLYKVYLHAITSHCLSDPLTGHTGTEQALHELSSAGCQSFQRLGTTEADLFRQITSLIPKRTFYPLPF